MKYSKQLGTGIAIIVMALIVWSSASHHSTPVSAASDSIKKIADVQELNTILDNAGDKLVVLDLYADWCGPCRMLHPTLVALADTFTGKTLFYRINIDENPGLAAAFRTGGIPYVVFMKNKQVVNTLVGLHPAASYKDIIALND